MSFISIFLFFVFLPLWTLALESKLRELEVGKPLPLKVNCFGALSRSHSFKWVSFCFKALRSSVYWRLFQRGAMTSHSRSQEKFDEKLLIVIRVP